MLPSTSADESKRRRRHPRRRRRWCLILVLVIIAVLYYRFASKEELSRDEEVLRHRLRPLTGTGPLNRWAEKVVMNGVDEHIEKISKVVHSVAGKIAVVLDEAIPERERQRIANRYIKLTGASAQDGWHREKASDLSLEHNAMAKNMPYDECDGDALTIIREFLPHFYSECDPEKPVWVSRCSIYMQSFIDVDEAHTDRSHDSVGFSVTAIWYPHERWHSGWGGETVFLSDNGSGDADLLLPVLPKPRRLLLFDSEIPHMAKPTSPISSPFAPSVLAHVTTPTTRTLGNRFSFVLRTLCGRKSVDDLLSQFDANHDNLLSRAEVLSLFRYLDIDRLDGALVRLNRIAHGGSTRGSSSYTADHLKTFFDIRYPADGDKPRVLRLDNASLTAALAA